jgi:cell division protein FtsQ
MDGGGRKLSSLSQIFGRSRGLDHEAGPVMSGPDINPVVLAVRSRARSFRRRLDALPLPRAGPGTVLALSFIICGWLYGTVVAGTAPALLSGIGSGVGLKPADIVLTGQVETAERELLDALALDGSRSVLGFDVARARSRLLALPWVRDVAIRKLYPGKLTVAVAEKRAAAVWQHHDRLTVVEQTGKPIAKFGITDLLNNRFSHLPHLVGEGASQKASEILPLIARYPSLAGQVTSYTRVADRRWDLGLANGIQVMLPESGLQDSLAQLLALAESDRLLERAVDVIDMRLADRVVLRLQTFAAEARAARVTTRLRDMKKSERKL